LENFHCLLEPTQQPTNKQHFKTKIRLFYFSETPSHFGRTYEWNFPPNQPDWGVFEISKEFSEI